jgi:hypothetical protein
VTAAGHASVKPDLDVGRAVADVLAGTWRAHPPALVADTHDIERAAPLLVEYGAAALAWPRIAGEPRLSHGPSVEGLHQAYRLISLGSTRKEAALATIAGIFASTGLEPLIYKGWAVARHYAKPHLRPLGDVDLCAPPGRHADAVALLRRHARPGLDSPRHGIGQARGHFALDCGIAGTCRIDLKRDLARFRLAPLERLYARARRVTLGGHVLRVPAPEDHLRLVAVHFLLHGGFRPLWLCDVGALLETAGPDFDWATCLGDDPRVARWIACVLALAQGLLGARLDQVPPAGRLDRLPPWLVPTVLREWQVPFAARTAEPTLGVSLRRPWALAAGVKRRWPNAIRSTVTFGGPLEERVRARYQWAEFGSRLASRLSRRLTTRRSSPPVREVAGR